jgi:hypothetical protein
MSRKVIGSSLGAFAVLIAVGICAYLAFAPLIPTRVVSVEGGVETVQTGTASVSEVAGWPALAALVVVTLVTAAPLLVRTRLAFLAAAVVLAVFAALTWATVGPFLVPLPLILLAAGLVTPGTSQQSPGSSANDLPEPADNPSART